MTDDNNMFLRNFTHTGRRKSSHLDDMQEVSTFFPLPLTVMENLKKQLVKYDASKIIGQPFSKRRE